jgi:hypothetical protein
MKERDSKTEQKRKRKKDTKEIAVLFHFFAYSGH